MEETMDNMSCYHSAKLADMSSRRINGATATAIGLSAAALVGVIGAALIGQSRARSAENLIASQQSANQNLNNLMIANNAAERNERIHQQGVIESYLLRQSCPQKVEMWSCTPCPCPQPSCGCGC